MVRRQYIQRPAEPPPWESLRTLVVIPTYQERENIVSVLRRVRAEADVWILVVDDSSPDGTADLARDVGKHLGRISVLTRPGKAGLGSAYLAGFAWGLERGFDVLVEMDADGSHDPADLERLLDAVRAGEDLVIGSRYVPGGSIPAWSLRRRSLSRFGNYYAQACLGLPVADLTAGFRAYRGSLLRRMALTSVRAEGYGFQIEMTRLAHAAGARVTEIPIRFVDRTAGQSKMSGRIVVEALLLVTLMGARDRFRSLARSWRTGPGLTPRPTQAVPDVALSSDATKPGGPHG